MVEHSPGFWETQVISSALQKREKIKIKHDAQVWDGVSVFAEVSILGLFWSLGNNRFAISKEIVW